MDPTLNPEELLRLLAAMLMKFHSGPPSVVTEISHCGSIDKCLRTMAKTCFSRNLLTIHKSEIGRELLALESLSDFGIGTICERFHTSGKQPVASDRLNRCVIDGTISTATSYNIEAAILSGPVAFLASNAINKCIVSDTGHSRYGKFQEGKFSVCVRFDSVVERAHKGII